MWKRLLIILVIVVLVLWSPWVHWSSSEEKTDLECRPLLGMFTREDRLCSGNNGLENIRLKPGDILVTLSTHSLGWRHGHAALVIDENTTLEAAVLGKDAVLCSVENWYDYGDVAVLRVKCKMAAAGDGMKFAPAEDIRLPELDGDMHIGEQAARYAMDGLQGRPYRLTAGLLGDKAPAVDTRMFGVQCAYLVWYAWQHLGYDLDDDGGRLVTCRDLLESENVDVIYKTGYS